MLLASLHDVSPRSLGQVQRLRDLLSRWGVDRATLLVVPDFHGGAPLFASPAAVRWLRTRSQAGDEICLHGSQHRESRRLAHARDRIRAAALTHGEAECLAASSSELEHMLRGGKQQLEDALGTHVSGFVAPAWLEPPGFAESLRQAGFRWHESSLWLERLGARPALDARWHGPVLSFAGHPMARRALSLAWVYALRQVVRWLAARRGGMVRVALHPADTRSHAVMRCASATVTELARALPAATYSQALASIDVR